MCATAAVVVSDRFNIELEFIISYTEGYTLFNEVPRETFSICYLSLRSPLYGKVLT